MMCGYTLRPESRTLPSAALLLCGFLWAQAVPVGFAEEGEPTTITSQTMTAEGDSQRAIFEGMVVLQKGDFVMRSARMIVTFEEGPRHQRRQTEEQALSQKIQRIEATGQVVIERSDGRATSGRAVYYKDEEKIVLTDSPVAWQRGTKVSGSRMTMFLKEDRSIVEGGSHVTILDEQGR